jgi:hypothetical protein
VAETETGEEVGATEDLETGSSWFGLGRDGVGADPDVASCDTEDAAGTGPFDDDWGWVPEVPARAPVAAGVREVELVPGDALAM